MPIKAPHLTALDIRVMFDYDSETGVISWRRSNPKNPHAGKQAGTVNTHGYRVIRIGKRLYSAHRVAWAHANGAWPESDLDHVNRQCDDNRLINLRQVTHTQNMQNRGVFVRNKVGVTGVYWHERDRVFRVRLTINKHTLHLGYFPSLLDAVAARFAAEKKYLSHKSLDAYVLAS